MHIDLNEAQSLSSLEAEICVIGAGAAGITTARRLLELGHSVTLLESGGFDYEPDTANLNAGDNVGDNYYELENARLRFFGGTTAIWGGRIAELDPIDLEVRDWVPHSGWPLRWEDLTAHYPSARKIFDIPASSATAADMRQHGIRLPAVDPQKIEFGIWDFDRRFDRFQYAACKDLPAHPRCTVVTHATVSELHLHPTAGHVESLSVRSMNGHALRITADAVVLAAGGVENPRLLLASRSVAMRGIGNDYDQVGRYFMEHPHARGGRVLGKGAWDLLNAFGRPHMLGSREVSALIKPSAKLQRERGILNTSLTIAARQSASAAQTPGMRAYSRLKHGIAPTARGRKLWMAAKKSATWLQHRTDPMRPWLLHQFGLRDLALVVRAEQAPNPLSRVQLSDQIDPLGVPRVALDWRMTELDTNSVSGLVDALGEELARLGLGTVEPSDWLRDSGTWKTDPLISAHPIGGYHHMGTTRMSNNPRHGVTDAYGRVHNVANLYVAGSSLFPTSGWANPTLTVLALALRTSEYISRRHARSAAA